MRVVYCENGDVDRNSVGKIGTESVYMWRGIREELDKGVVIMCIMTIINISTRIPSYYHHLFTPHPLLLHSVSLFPFHLQHAHIRAFMNKIPLPVSLHSEKSKPMVSTWEIVWALECNFYTQKILIKFFWSVHYPEYERPWVTAWTYPYAPMKPEDYSCDQDF